MAKAKGVQQGMKIYYMGRFAIDLPEEFKLEIQSQKLCHAEVSDFKWKERDRDKEREVLWAQKIVEINKLEVPRDKKKVIIEEVKMPDLGKWAKGILYYGDYSSSRRLFWTVLVDYGTTGVWLKIAGIKKDQLVKHSNDLLSRYQYGHDHLTKSSFCLVHGKFEFAYEEQEESYTRFAGPMGMKLEVELRVIYEVKKAGILENFTASLESNLASGVDVDTIRMGKRIIANMAGEEILSRISDSMGPKFYFGWEYLGREDSGNYPQIHITVEECPDGNLDEKIKIWDAVLETFRPVSNP